MIDGPQGMIGQELKVFTEAVKLGRDPQRADMTFYAPEANSSVSGLHARIERVNGAWRIISVSQSSETFLDDIAIPSNEPYPLQSGSTIRLGYPAQQPVVFSFYPAVGITEMPPRRTETGDVDIRKTDVSDVTMATGAKGMTPKRAEPDKSDDSVFDEFRDR